MQGDFLVDVEVVVLVRGAGLGKVGAGVDEAGVAVFDGGADAVVRAGGTDVKGDLAVVAQD